MNAHNEQPAAAQGAVAWINPDDLSESPRAIVCRNSVRNLSCNERYTMPLYAALAAAPPSAPVGVEDV